jgi:iron complex outermembrane recepter protein
LGERPPINGAASQKAFLSTGTDKLVSTFGEKFMSKFKINSAALFTGSVSRIAIGLALTGAVAMPAFAQDTAPVEEEGEIIVSGIRASLNSSAKLKEGSAAIVDSITAEDIGKLPDVSIADSLARLPGLTAQRLEGRDQRLSIRGLGPDFGTTLLNGREQVTVGDNRGVEYDQYPSEFFRNVVVYKSANANLVPAGISGTVDLRMLRPLSQNNRIIAVQARGQMNGLKALNPDGKRFGFRTSAAFVDKFADDTIGISLGVSVSQSPSQNERYAAWGFPNAPEVGGNLLLGGAKPYVQSNLLKRYGAVGTIEFQPSDNFHSTFDVLYSKFKEKQQLRGIEFPINPGWGSGAVVQRFTAAGGIATDVTLTNVHAVQRNDINKRDAENLSLGWNNVFGLSDTMHFTVDASWSKAKRTDFLLETYTGTGYNQAGPGDTIRITQNSNGTFDIVPTLNYTNTALFGITDPRGWGYNGTTAVVQAGFLNRPSFKDDLKALRASLDGEFGDAGVLKSWEIGANYSRRKKTSAYTSFFLCPKGAGTNCTVASGTPTFVPVPQAAIIGSVPLAYLGVPAALALDPLYLYNNTLNAVFDNRPSSLVRDNSVTEKILTGYAQINIDGELGGRPIKGAIGAQVVNSKQSSDGTISNFRVVNGAGVVSIFPAFAKTSYTDFLPSATFSVELADGLYYKAGASQTMVRARLDQLRVNQEFGIDITRLGSTVPGQSVFSSNGGNTNLRPYKSTNIDMSVEKYFGKGGYISVASYFKNLTNFVDNNNSYLFDFSAAVNTLSPADRLIVGTTLGRASAPGNTGRGHLAGVEATLSLPFENFSDALDGFGIFTSGSYTDSKIRFGNNPQGITIPGQSKWVGTAEAYFEKSGFQAKVAYRYRGKFLAELAGLSANPEFRTAKSEGILDAQIGYEFQEGSALQGLSIQLQGKNLTDRPFVTYEGGNQLLVREYQHYGRDFYLSLAYKF